MCLELFGSPTITPAPDSNLSVMSTYYTRFQMQSKKELPYNRTIIIFSPNNIFINFSPQIKQENIYSNKLGNLEFKKLKFNVHSQRPFFYYNVIKYTRIFIVLYAYRKTRTMGVNLKFIS